MIIHNKDCKALQKKGRYDLINCKTCEKQLICLFEYEHNKI